VTALGRQEEWEDSPESYPQTPPYEWWDWHDTTAAAQVTAQLPRPTAGTKRPTLAR
jgi:hypothetical protein